MTKTSWTTKQHKQAYLHFPNKKPIDSESITAIRYALFDNEYGLSHQFIKKRYRVEVQLWEGENRAQADHKLVGFLAPLNTFYNLRYNKENPSWYKMVCDQAKKHHEDHGSNYTVLHCGLGQRYTNNKGTGNAYQLTPQVAATVVMPNNRVDPPAIVFYMNTLEDIQLLEEERDHDKYRLNYHYKEVN